MFRGRLLLVVRLPALSNEVPTPIWPHLVEQRNCRRRPIQVARVLLFHQNGDGAMIKLPRKIPPSSDQMLDVDIPCPVVSNRSIISSIRKYFRKTFQRGDPVQVNDDVLQLIFSKLDLENRMRMSLISTQTYNVVERMPLIIPFMMFRNDNRGNYEIYSDNLEILAGYVLEDCPGFRMCGEEKIVFNERFAHIVMGRILERVSGVTQLWLECSTNGLLCQNIVDFYRVINKNGSIRRRFKIDQLTVIGKTTREGDFQSLGALILLSRHSMEAIRLSHTRVNNEEDALCLWTAIGQCRGLRQLQYEPCKPDTFSRPHVVQALTGLKLASLIITGIREFNINDIISINGKKTISELAVVSDQIQAKSYVSYKARKILGTLNSLLVQLDQTFSVEDDKTRCHLLEVLRALPEVACLEIIQVTQGSIPDITRALSYWLRLARETNRVIKLKLEECSQERQDAAVGRLIRKSRESNKVEWSPRGLTLSCGGEGRVVLLDRQTWFGYED